jgi:hypothetical protein
MSDPKRIRVLCIDDHPLSNWRNTFRIAGVQFTHKFFSPLFLANNARRRLECEAECFRQMPTGKWAFRPLSILDIESVLSAAKLSGTTCG